MPHVGDSEVQVMVEAVKSTVVGLGVCCRRYTAMFYWSQPCTDSTKYLVQVTPCWSLGQHTTLVAYSFLVQCIPAIVVHWHASPCSVCVYMYKLRHTECIVHGHWAHCTYVYVVTDSFQYASHPWHVVCVLIWVFECWRSRNNPLKHKMFWP